jgi:hypothetical protein
MDGTKFYIAHRGLLTGPDFAGNLENNPKQLESIIHQGYDAEVDLWYIDETWYLGNKGPQYEISRDFLEKNAKHLWYHTKNEGAFKRLVETDSEKTLNYFWQAEDSFDFTSHGWAWVHPESRPFSEGIWVLPEQTMRNDSSGWWNLLRLQNQECRGYCSNYIQEIRNIMEPKKEME